jgi:mono/diheme cytochrome c family protein
MPPIAGAAALSEPPRGVSFPRAQAVLFLLALAAVGGFVALAWRPALEPVDPPARASFTDAAIARGAALARIGNCITCHTAEGGAPFAGGRGIDTPFGVIYGTNITPEPDSGIGRWSQDAFVRSMREGVARDGRHLYPAFPYDHFRLATDADLAALYAYVMTREPVHAEAAQTQLPFPFNMRPLLAGWKLLFAKRDEVPADPAQSPEWNRGAYLVHGLAHCGSCHTPRNFLGAEKAGQAFAGGRSGGWDGPPLDKTSPAPRAWSVEAVHAYLREGMAPGHSLAAGPMQEVVRNLAQAPAADVRAMAVYIASLMPGEAAGSAAAGGSGKASPSGLYEAACAGCHRGRERGGALELSLATAVHLERPRNLLNVIHGGIAPREGETGPWMPAYRGAFTGAQLAEIANHLRTQLAGRPAWEKVEP